jgi:hypothetical protein
MTNASYDVMKYHPSNIQNCYDLSIFFDFIIIDTQDQRLDQNKHTYLYIYMYIYIYIYVYIYITFSLPSNPSPSF